MVLVTVAHDLPPSPNWCVEHAHGFGDHYPLTHALTPSVLPIHYGHAALPIHTCWAQSGLPHLCFPFVLPMQSTHVPWYVLLHVASVMV